MHLRINAPRPHSPYIGRAVRVVLPGCAHHIYTARQSSAGCFLLRQRPRALDSPCRSIAPNKAGLSILGCCLITKHVHLVTTPERPTHSMPACEGCTMITPVGCTFGSVAPVTFGRIASSPAQVSRRSRVTRHAPRHATYPTAGETSRSSASTRFRICRSACRSGLPTAYR